jgi:hypothetical protein
VVEKKSPSLSEPIEGCRKEKPPAAWSFFFSCNRKTLEEGYPIAEKKRQPESHDAGFFIAYAGGCNKRKVI